jgi:hypothetical protein
MIGDKMQKSVKGQAVIAEVRRVAAESPDHINDSPCVYVYRAQPKCLIGHGLWAAGLINKNFARPLNNEIIDGQDMLSHLADAMLTDDEITWLRMVQIRQDSGQPWGEAVRSTDRYLQETRDE